MILRAAFYQDPTVAFLEPLTQMSVQIFSRDLIFVILPVNIMHPSNYNKLTVMSRKNLHTADQTLICQIKVYPARSRFILPDQGLICQIKVS